MDIIDIVLVFGKNQDLETEWSVYECAEALAQLTGGGVFCKHSKR